MSYTQTDATGTAAAPDAELDGAGGLVDRGGGETTNAVEPAEVHGLDAAASKLLGEHSRRQITCACRTLHGHYGLTPAAGARHAHGRVPSRRRLSHGAVGREA